MVSVIIPNYNHAPFLKRRIDSVLNQTYQDIEVILLDDCSTDNSVEILNSYKAHPKVSHIVVNETNSGSPFKQWNKGFQLAKGDYIWIAESDDWCEPTLLDELVPPMVVNEKIDLAYCQSLVVAHDGSVVYKTQSERLDKTVSGRDFVAKDMFGDPVLINSGMAVFRKNALRRVDPQYLNYQSAGDWLFWNSLAIGAEVFVSGKYLNYFSRDISTVSSRAEMSGVDIKEACMIFNWVKEYAEPSEMEIILAINERIQNYYWQEKKFTNKEVKKSVLANLKALDKRVPNLMRKYKIKQSIKRLF